MEKTDLVNRFNDFGITQTQKNTLPETNIFEPENGWFQILVSLWDGLFSGAILVSGSVYKKSKESLETHGISTAIATSELDGNVEKTQKWSVKSNCFADFHESLSRDAKIPIIESCRDALFT